MKKVYVLVMISMLFLSLGIVSAKTLIAGKVYNSDFTLQIEGANVSISCSDGNLTATADTVTIADGSYAAEFLETGPDACNDGYTLFVTASHADHGFNTVGGPSVVGGW